jgi:hypothetical protein
MRVTLSMLPVCYSQLPENTTAVYYESERIIIVLGTYKYEVYVVTSIV